jgi:ArsR family transcriptional regulator
MVQQMDDEEAVQCVTALAHEVRMRMFRYLMELGPSGAVAGEIVSALDTSKTGASFHFKELHRAGLIRSTREGRNIRYQIHIEKVQELFSHLLTSYCSARPKQRGNFIVDLTKQLKRFEGTR